MKFVAVSSARLQLKLSGITVFIARTLRDDLQSLFWEQTKQKKFDSLFKQKE